MASTDAAVLQGLFDQLSDEAKEAIYDAYGVNFITGGSVSEIDNELVASIQPAEVWAPSSLVIGGSTGAIRGEVAKESEVSLAQYQSTRVAIGVVASEAAPGFLIPAAVELTSNADLTFPLGVAQAALVARTQAVLKEMVPLAVADLDALQAASIYDARNIAWQLRSVSGSGPSVRGGKRFVGVWYLFDDLGLGVVTTEPDQLVEVRHYIQADTVEDNRGLEVGPVLDFIQAEANREPRQHARINGEVPAAEPFTWSPPVDPGYYFVESVEVRWGNKVKNQSKQVAPLDTLTDLAPGQYFPDSLTGGTYYFSSDDAGRQFNTTYWSNAHEFTQPQGRVTPTPTTAWFAQRKDVVGGVLILRFPDAGPHVIQLAARGDGSVGTGTLMARVLPRSYEAELTALLGG